MKTGLLAAAVACLVIALLLAVGAFTGSNGQDWEIGGLLAFVSSFLVP